MAVLEQTQVVRLPPQTSHSVSTAPFVDDDTLKGLDTIHTIPAQTTESGVDQRMHTGVDRRQHHTIYVREGEWKGSFGAYVASFQRKELSSETDDSGETKEYETLRDYATVRLEQNGMVVSIPFEFLWDRWVW
jgi:hypothetical protein